jgi:hypothetical protein
MDDPAALGRHFRGVSWDAWRAFLKAPFALPMSGDRVRHLSAVHGSQRAACGAVPRGYGHRWQARWQDKDIGTHRRLFGFPLMAPGELATIAVIAVDRKEARNAFSLIGPSDVASNKDYYNRARTHLSLNKDAPVPRAIEAVGRIHASPILSGLHHPGNVTFAIGHRQAHGSNSCRVFIEFI